MVNIQLSKQDVKMVLSAISSVHEYSTRWDNLYGRVTKQVNKNENKQSQRSLHKR